MRAYLAGYGPATRSDIATCTKLPLSRIDAALAALGPLRRLAGPGGDDLVDLPDAGWPDEDTAPPPRLLAKWDSALLSHADRRRIMSDEVRVRVIRRANGDVLSTYLLDGAVAGEWRLARAGHRVTVTLVPFTAGTGHGSAALEAECLRLAAIAEPDAQTVEIVTADR